MMLEVIPDDGKPPSTKSERPCPECGNYEWYTYIRNVHGLLESVPTQLCVIDRNFDPDVDYTKVIDFDECTNCHIVVS